MATNNNKIQYSEYIKTDKTEELVEQNSKDSLSKLQEENRSISYFM